MSLYLLLTLLVVGAPAQSITDFRHLVYTDSLTLKETQTGQPPTESNRTFPLPTFFHLGTYSHAVTFRRVELSPEMGSNSKYGLQLITHQELSALKIDLVDPFGKAKNVQVRILVVSSKFPYLLIEHPTPLTSFNLNRSNDKVEDLQVSVSCLSCKVYTFVGGFMIRSNSNDNLTFHAESTLAGNNLKLNLSTNIYESIGVELLNLTVVLFNQANMAYEYSYSFQNSIVYSRPVTLGSSDNPVDSDSYYTYTNTTIQNEGVFYGISGIIFTHNSNQDIDFTLSHTANQLNINKQNKFQVDIAYLIFSRSIVCQAGTCWNPTTNKCTLTTTTPCLDCPANCLTCTTPGSCSLCSPYYNKSASGHCQLNCSLIHPGCKYCDPDVPSCSSCGDYYQPIPISSTECKAICGDGMMVGEEECDDQNDISGDGCFDCKQEPYFKCNKSDNNSFQGCYFQEFAMEYKCTVKDPTANSFTATYQLVPPGITFYLNQQWTQTITPGDSLTTLQTQYDSTSSRIRATFTYDENWQRMSSSITTNFDSLSSAFDQFKAQANEQLTAENNLSLNYYSGTTYSLATVVKYMSYLLAALAILFFVLGNCGAKLAALEAVAVFQVTALLQFTLSEMSPTFDSLFPLSATLGITSFLTTNHYYQESPLLPNIKAQLPSRNPFISINIFLLFLVCPWALGLIFRYLSRKNDRMKRVYQKSWKNCMGTFAFYGLLFLTYAVITLMAVNLRYFQLSFEAGVGIAIGVIYITVLVVYIVYSYHQALWFGSFRNKFQKFTCGYHFYTFSTIEKMLTPVIVIAMSPIRFTPILVCLFPLFQAIFIAVKRPYLLGVWKRPFFNKIVIICLALLYFLVDVFGGASMVAVYGPFLVLALLVAVLVVGVVCSVPEIREYKEDMQVKWKLPCTTQECNEFIERQFQKKILDFEDNPFKHIHPDMSNIRLMRSKWNWENYPILYSLNPKEVIRIGEEKKVHQEEEDSQSSHSSKKIVENYYGLVQDKENKKGPPRKEQV